jgi:hypothetical protein
MTFSPERSAAISRFPNPSKPNGPGARVFAGLVSLFCLAVCVGGVWMFAAVQDLRVVAAVVAMAGLICAIPFGYIAWTGKEPSPPSLWF